MSACLIIYLVSALFISADRLVVRRARRARARLRRDDHPRDSQQQQTLTEAAARQMAEALSRTPPSQMINDLMRLTETRSQPPKRSVFLRERHRGRRGGLRVERAPP